MKKTLLITALSLLYSLQVQATDVNITADERVEWHQNEQKIIALGNAVATKEDMNIKADKMTAYYEGRAQTTKGQSKIKKVEARGNVKMHSNRADAFGNSMDYDLVKDEILLIGQPAKIVTDKETITAEENITYYPNQQRAIALGNVMATDKDNKIYSDKMIAYFQKVGNTSNLEIQKIEIFGNVKIVSPSANVTADRGVYLPKNSLVKLYDNVIIDQDGNIIKGDKAESNLATGISKMLSGSKNGKVRGVFKEKSDDKSKKKKSVKK